MSQILNIIQNNTLPVAKRTRRNNPSLLNPIQNKKKEVYVSATEFDNFCENDPISDWFSVISKEYNIERNVMSNLDFLFKKGNDHEEKTVNKLREKTGLLLENMSSVKTSREYDSYDKLEKKDFNRTMNAMAEGEPIIYSSYICNKKDKVRGIPDLLVRNDYISKLFNNLPYDLEIEEEKSIFGSYYYIPVEIKFSSVELSASNKYILNKGRMKIYKTQLFTYCKILEEIQGVKPTKVFIIGKRTILYNKEIKDSLEYPGVVDYSKTYDSCYSDIFEKGLEWLKNVKENGLSWSFDDMMNKQLFPNMKSANMLFYKDKKELSDKYGEITELWRCSTLTRQNALNYNIYSWKDKNFNAEISGLSKSYQKSLDNILKVNREDFDYFPLSFVNQSFKNIENEAFVDFEILRDSFDIDSYGDSEWIFLIGVRYKGEYTQFLMNSLSDFEEKKVITEFYEFLSKNNFPKCWYWCAETKFWNRALNRYNFDFKDNIKWDDLYQLFTNESFAVKGSMNFKLKSYIKNLVKLNKINVSLPPENCSDGISAMTIAWNYYMDNKNEDDMKDVIYYNSLDCQYVEELLNFARNNL
jgi:hypothetical protein